MVAKNLLDRIIALPVEQRQELLDRIAESLRNDLASGSLSDEERRILDQRLADLERNPNDQSPWEDVETRIRAKLGQS